MKFARLALLVTVCAMLAASPPDVEGQGPPPEYVLSTWRAAYTSLENGVTRTGALQQQAKEGTLTATTCLAELQRAVLLEANAIGQFRSFNDLLQVYLRSPGFPLRRPLPPNVLRRIPPDASDAERMDEPDPPVDESQPQRRRTTVIDRPASKPSESMEYQTSSLAEPERTATVGLLFAHSAREHTANSGDAYQVRHDDRRRRVMIVQFAFGAFRIDHPLELVPGQATETVVVFKPVALSDPQRLTHRVTVGTSDSYVNAVPDSLIFEPLAVRTESGAVDFALAERVPVDFRSEINWTWRTVALPSFRGARFTIELDAAYTDGQLGAQRRSVARFPVDIRAGSGRGWWEWIGPYVGPTLGVIGGLILSSSINAIRRRREARQPTLLFPPGARW